MRSALLSLAAAAVIGCAASSTPGASIEVDMLAPASSPSIDLTIFGAASLSRVLGEAETAYEASAPGTTLTISTDSSAALEAQIEQGAPADLFLAADTTTPRKLIDAGLALGDAVMFAGNELTVVVPKGNPGRIASPADLARDGVKVIAAGDEVPISRYAARLIANLANEPDYPPYFARRYEANIVSKEDSVTAVVAKVELGEGDAGIVYVTDARTSSDVETVPIPAATNVRARYAGVVVKASPHAAEATSLLDWFAGPHGQEIMSRFGFLPPG